MSLFTWKIKTFYSKYDNIMYTDIEHICNHNVQMLWKKLL